MLTLIAILFAAGYADLGSGDHRRTVSLAGEKRSYLVHVPPQYDPAKSISVVLAFHGEGRTLKTWSFLVGLMKQPISQDSSWFILTGAAGCKGC
jgi:poly(3-hydroxybutyrate) depolymerase